MPLYEYACGSCGGRVEQMRKADERLASPSCPACGQPMALALSVPGKVGRAGAATTPSPGWGESCAPGGCGGGACAPTTH
jgi:putative FmdB family regulatory protein